MSEENQSRGWAEALARFSLDRRISVLVVMLTIVVVGVVAMLGIPVELIPRGFQSQSLFVFVPWQSAPTREVLDKITLPLEEELSTVRGLDGVNSYSSIGRCNVFLRFKQGTDMAVAYREVRDRVQRARARFPDDVDRVFIRKDDASGIPVAVIGLAIDPSLTDSYNLVKREVVEALSRIDGVANVGTDGLEEKEIIIELDRKLTESNGLNIYQLAQSMAGDNFTMASGTVREGGGKFLLRSMASFKSLDELQDLPLTPTVRLKDVAKIRYEEAEKRYIVRVNSRPAVAVVVMKTWDANTLEVSDRIAREIVKIQSNPRLNGIEMEDLFNQGKAVREAIDGLVSGGVVGSLLSAAILFVFLRRVRLTFIITLSVPLSLLVALVVMYFAHETLNILTLLALVISVGMLVDNSICVAENIHDFHERGLSRREACLKGTSEIALAITLATLTSVIVFVPAALVEGEGQFFLIRLALPISVSLLSSLVIALVLVPLSVYLTLSPRSSWIKSGRVQAIHDRADVWMTRAYEATLGRVNRAYATWLGHALRHRFDVTIALIAVFGLTVYVAMKKVKVLPNQEEDQAGFAISAEASNEYSFEDMKEYFAEIEKVLEKRKESYGLKGYFVLCRSRFGRIEGWFDRKKPDHPPAKEIGKKLLDSLPTRPGIKLFIGRESQTRESKNREVYVLNLEGDEPETLDALADRLEPMILGVRGVIGIRQGNEKSPKELAFVIDRDRANASDVNPQFIAGAIGYALRGNALAKYNDHGKEIPVRIRFQESDRESVADLKGFSVPTSSGGMVPLSGLTDSKMLNSPQGIFRRNKRITRTLAVELASGEAKETRERLMGLQKQVDLPEGVFFGSSLFDTEQEKEMANLIFAGSLSILFIYLLMGFLFESFLLPLSIVMTIPLAGLGVVWLHFITGRDMDFLGVVGVILLVGVVVNNGIVLIDYVHRLRQGGTERARALVEAAERRFRPIMMTALTTVLGMIPMAVSRPTEIGISYSSFGLTLIGGMTTATLLTLLVVPVFYTFFDDLREFVGAKLVAVARSSGKLPVPNENSTPHATPR